MKYFTQKVLLLLKNYPEIAQIFFFKYIVYHTICFTKLAMKI